MRPRTRAYTARRIPARIHTEEVEIDRAQAGKICEQLSISVVELTGAAFFTPNFDEESNTGRFEFHYWSTKYKTEYRLGIIVKVVGNKATVHGYLTDPECVEEADRVPNIPDDLQPRLWARIREIYEDAEQRASNEEKVSSFHLFFMKGAHKGGYLEKTELSDMTIYPTIRIRQEDVSPVVISAEAAHSVSARTAANRKFKMLCALSTLVYGQPFTQSFPKIPPRKSVRHVKSLSPDLSEILRIPYILFPQSADHDSSERTKWIYSTLSKIGEGDLELFTRAVFAFYAGSQSSALPTLGVVAHAAAMAALADEFKKPCTGDSCCSTCGPLPGRHNLIGEGRAILMLVQSTRELSTDETSTVKKLINRIYSEQRSSYVHAAETRHNEKGEEQTEVSLTPSDSQPAQKIYYFQTDAHNFARLTRRTLIRWLSKRAEVEFNPELLKMPTDTIITHTQFTMNIGLKAGIWAKIDPF